MAMDPPVRDVPSRRPDPRLPVILGTASLLANGAAAAFWGNLLGRVGIPVTSAVLGPVLALVGGFVLWRRPHHRIAALMAGTGLAFSIATLAAALLNAAAVGTLLGRGLEQPALLLAWATAALAVPWMLLVLWFPDGRFTSPRWRAVVAAVGGTSIAVVLAGYLFGPPGELPGILTGAVLPATLSGPFGSRDGGIWLVAADVLTVFPLAAVPSLVGRYRRAGAVVRQQIHWMLAAVCVTVAASLLAGVLPDAGAGTSWVRTMVVALTQPLPALAIAVAVLRYRLWDIDLLVSSTLVYGVVWAALSALLLVPAALSGYLVGGRTALAAVVVALIVTVAFQPLRRRLQRAVEGWLLGPRRQGLRRLAAFGETLRRAVDVADLGPELAATLQRGLGTAWAAVWLRLSEPEGDLVLVGSAGGTAPPAMTVGSPVLDRIGGAPLLGGEVPGELRGQLPQDTAAVVALVTRGELVGLLACGPRRDPPLGERDREPLARFATESALGLRNLRLEEELRARIRQVETQAVALRDSRERLVRAQDEERRRIERDLHDGVQQQLVGLAAGLRRLVSAGALREECDVLADAAEDAVFALQDLARGIFPAVLTDQGLVAALRTQAARTPLPVRLEVDPALDHRRFDAAVETALYFAALEALTNAAKHAPDATVTVRLHADEMSVTLQVSDDGPGWAGPTPAAGSGMANMRDRIGAAGGSFEVSSVPGRGLRIEAVVPLAQPAAAGRSATGSRRTLAGISAPRPLGD